MTQVAIRDEDTLFEILAIGGTIDDGEPVDLLAHSLQCASLLAGRAPADPELCVAGLVHDVGTLLVPGAPDAHARIGARSVQTLLGARVATLVAAHDVAKRYLVSTDPDYRDRLSARSLATLDDQGGALTPAEIDAFAATPEFAACLTLRRADDEAKVPLASTPPLDSWRGLVADVARRTRVHGSSQTASSST